MSSSFETKVGSVAYSSEYRTCASWNRSILPSLYDSYKLGKILRFHDAHVLYSDEYATDPTFVSKEELIAQSDIVIVGVPHRAYGELMIPARTHLVDLWGVIPVRREGPDAHLGTDAKSTAPDFVTASAVGNSSEAAREG